MLLASFSQENIRLQLAYFITKFWKFFVIRKFMVIQNLEDENQTLKNTWPSLVTRKFRGVI